MASEGRVIGSSSDVESLSQLAGLCLQAIEEVNDKGKSLLGNLSGSTTDKAYDEAEGVVGEVEGIVAGCQEPLAQVQSALKAYAEFLASLE